MQIDTSRWIIHETFIEAKSRKFHKVTCMICNEMCERVRSDLLPTKKCACNRKQRGIPLKKGDRFGKLTVIQRSESRGKNVFYTVSCDCGTVKDLQANQLLSGNTKSCGCLLEAKRGSRRENHGLAKTKEYKIWSSIIKRTSFPHKSTRKWYYDKGIKMSDEWRSSFVKFLEDMGNCPDGYSIDRIDPDGDYCKENCRWASKALQSINKGLYETNTSGKTGVSFIKRDSKWVAYIYVGEHRIHLGTFSSFEEACAARDEAEIKYRSHIKE